MFYFTEKLKWLIQNIWTVVQMLKIQSFCMLSGCWSKLLLNQQVTATAWDLQHAKTVINTILHKASWKCCTCMCSHWNLKFSLQGPWCSPLLQKTNECEWASDLQYFVMGRRPKCISIYSVYALNMAVILFSWKCYPVLWLISKH